MPSDSMGKLMSHQFEKEHNDKMKQRLIEFQERFNSELRHKKERLLNKLRSKDPLARREPQTSKTSTQKLPPLKSSAQDDIQRLLGRNSNIARLVATTN